MSTETNGTSSVEVERFARVFVKGPEELPSHADTYFDPERGYYFKLHLDEVSVTEATPLIEKAQERFKVDLVRRVQQDGFYKERVYVDSPGEVPDGFKVHRGPDGGIYYETGVQQVGVAEGSDETRNVAVIHWDDVELGDDIVFETPEGEEMFAEITDIEEQAEEADVIHVDAGGETYQAQPGTYSTSETDEKSLPTPAGELKAEGTVTSGTPGVHSARYSPQDDREDDEEENEGKTSDPRDIGKEDDVWTYYYGPDGGEGWMNMRTGEIRYQQARPGQAPEDGDGYGDWLNDDWTSPPEDPNELLPGQKVELWNPLTEGHVEGEVTGFREGEPEIDAEGIPANNTLLSEIAEEGGELTAIEEVGDVHPTNPDKIALDPQAVEGEIPDWAQQYEPGDTMYVDTSAVSVIDEPAREASVMGWNRHGQGLNIQPFEEIVEDNPETDTILVTDNNELSPEEYENILSGQQALEERGLEVGEDVVLEDEVYGEYIEAEVVEPVDGRVAVESEDGGTFFLDDEDFSLVEEYRYDPDDFNFSEGIDMSEVEIMDAVWVEGEGPYRVGSTPHPDDQHLRVFDEAGDELHDVEMEEIDAHSDETPPTALDWWEGAPPLSETIGVTDLEAGDTVEVDADGYDEYPDYEGPAEIVSGLDDGYVAETPDGEEVLVGYTEVEGETDSSVMDEFHGNNLSTVEGYEEPEDFEPGDTVTIDLTDNAPEDQVQATVIDTNTSEYTDTQNYVEVDLHGEEVDGKMKINMGSDWNRIVDVGGESGAQPEETEPEGEAPDVDEDSSAVAEPASAESEDTQAFDPTDYTPEDATGDKDMSAIGANHGNSKSAKHVVETPDGGQMVHTDLSHDSISVEDGERQMTGYHAMKHLDDNTLAHSADLGPDGWFANEVAPGVDVKDAGPEHTEAVDADDFHEMAAVQTIIGNADAHQNNIRVDEDGNLYAFDLDRAAGNVQGDWVGAFSHYDNTLDRIFGELEKSASALGIEMDRQQVIEAAEEVAQGLSDEEIVEIREDMMGVNPEFASTIRNNIAAFRNGEVEP